MDPNTKDADMPVDFSSSFRATLHLDSLWWPSNGLWFLSHASYFKGQVSITVRQSLPLGHQISHCLSSPLFPYPRFLLLRLIFHFKPNFSFLLHFVGWQPPRQPSPPHQSPSGMGPQAEAVLIIPISHSVDELSFPHDYHHHHHHHHHRWVLPQFVCL